MIRHSTNLKYNCTKKIHFTKIKNLLQFSRNQMSFHCSKEEANKRRKKTDKKWKNKQIACGNAYVWYRGLYTANCIMLMPLLLFSLFIHTMEIYLPSKFSLSPFRAANKHDWQTRWQANTGCKHSHWNTSVYPQKCMLFTL